MESPFLATPVARKGLSSKVLRRQSKKLSSDHTLFDAHEPMDTMCITTTDFLSATSVRAPNFLEATKITWMVEDKLGDAYPILQSSDDLFADFLASISAPHSGFEALDQVAELEELISVHCEALCAHKRHMDEDETLRNVFHQLMSERKTWRLIGKLYVNRLKQMSLIDEDVAPVVWKTSEKKIIERLFDSDVQLREAVIVVEWLESNFEASSDIQQQMNFFTDSSVANENTLDLLLQKPHGTRNNKFVTRLDPDAPRRQGKVLHDLDTEDEKRLHRLLFLLIRCGLLEKAQDVCVKIGQPWRAATLEGWKLFHDPNYGAENSADEKLPVEGNPHRDLWKRAVWKMTQDQKLSNCERAIYSTLCGNVNQLLTMCYSWEDYLWSYFKGMIDLKAEAEIREFLPRKFCDLPKEYWENKTTFESIFDAISASDLAKVKGEDLNLHHCIQKFVILRDMERLSDYVSGIAHQIKDNPHALRFVANFVIMMRRLEDSVADMGSDVIRQYVDYLINTNRVHQVAWYVSQLELERQIELYARFLTNIQADPERKLALNLALKSNLPVKQIKSRVVSMVFDSHNVEDDNFTKGEQDKRKIHALGWLLYDNNQRDEAVLRANDLIRFFVGFNKYDEAKQAWAMVPLDSIELMTHFCSDNDQELDQTRDTIITEYICWQAYFRAKDAFTDWFEHFHKERPKMPVLAANPTFTEKVGHEQRMKQYAMDLDRWQSTQTVQADEAISLLKAVVTFRGGWLVDPNVNSEHTNESQRHKEMDYLRKVCLPDLVLLCHNILHYTEQYDEAIALANLVASERFCLYEVYNKENMKELLVQIRNSSLKAMEIGKDALGWTVESSS